MQSGHSTSFPTWNNHVELDGFRVQFGDGSLRLMDPRHSEHTGGYTCVFSTPYNTHTERTDVTIGDPEGKSTNTVTGRRGRREDWFRARWEQFPAVALRGSVSSESVPVTHLLCCYVESHKTVSDSYFCVHLCVFVSCVQLSGVFQKHLLIGGLPVRWSRFWFWDWPVSWPT